MTHDCCRRWTSPARHPRACGPRSATPGCDALLVTNLINIRYLTGFTGSAGLLLVTPDDVVLVTDGRYRDQSAEQLAAAGVDAAHRDRPHRRRARTATLQAAAAARHRPARPRGRRTSPGPRSAGFADDWFPTPSSSPPRASSRSCGA